ncbi:MAG: hypothetical protein VX278_13005 [Myxococcota bacterium]|nr:hypothetical protein [Myxococcota bacterium]
MWFLFACMSGKITDTAEIEVIDPFDWSALEIGPYRVGYQQGVHSYTILDRSNEIDMNVWYPTEDSDGEPARYFNVRDDENAFQDASWADSVYSNGYPLMVFSHGSHLFGGSSAFLMRYFASHGWVVVAPDHKGHLTTDYLNELELSVYYERFINNNESLNFAESLGVNAQAAILIGYSFGALDGWANAGSAMNLPDIQALCDAGEFPAGCREDELDLFREGFGDARWRGIVAMAGANRYEWISEEGRSNLLVPMMQISGSEDDDEPQRLFDNVRGTPLHWVDIEGACHQLFVEVPCPNVSLEEGLSVVEGYSLAAARHSLLQDRSDQIVNLLDGSSSFSDKATIQWNGN